MVFYHIFGFDQILIFYVITNLQRLLQSYFHIHFYEIHICFLLQKNEGNLDNVIPLNNSDSFLTAR